METGRRVHTRPGAKKRVSESAMHGNVRHMRAGSTGKGISSHTTMDSQRATSQGTKVFMEAA
eukprot:363873-Chlamydomonas_euryale.AAC.23